MMRLKEYPLLGRFLSTVLPVHQFWLGAYTGFSTMHYCFRFATSWACQSADVQLWVGHCKEAQLSWKKYLQWYGRGRSSLNRLWEIWDSIYSMDREPRPLIWQGTSDGLFLMFLFAPLVNILKIFTYKKLMQRQHCPIGLKSFYETFFFLVRPSHLPHTVWLLQSRMVCKACSTCSHLLVLHCAFCAELMGFANAALTLTH